MASRKTVKTKAKSRVLARPKRRRAPYRQAVVKLASIECETIAQAEERLGGAAPLASVLREFPKLQDAWDRGRHLRNVRGLAAGAASFSEAAHVLGLTEEQFLSEIDRDPEIRDTWNQTRIATAVRVKAALVVSAAEGKVAAINQVLAALRRDVAQPRVDFHALCVSQTEIAMGVTRQSLHAWTTEKGAPRNSDGTFSLPALVAWRESWIVNQARLPAGRIAPLANANPLASVRAEKYRMEIDQQRGLLLNRTDAVGGLVARQQAMVSAFQRAEVEMVPALRDQPPARIAAILRSFFDQIRRSMCQVPESLRLPPAAAELLHGLLKAICDVPPDSGPVASLPAGETGEASA